MSYIKILFKSRKTIAKLSIIQHKFRNYLFDFIALDNYETL